MLKLHMNLLIYKDCFPTIHLIPEYIDMFECDRHEFVHHKNSPITNFYGLLMTDITLINDLVKNRGKDVTQGMLGLLTDIMSRYDCSAWVRSTNTTYLRSNFPRICR